jgi:hypothetical protein
MDGPLLVDGRARRVDRAVLQPLISVPEGHDPLAHHRYVAAQVASTPIVSSPVSWGVLNPPRSVAADTPNSFRSEHRARTRDRTMFTSRHAHRHGAVGGRGKGV